MAHHSKFLSVNLNKSYGKPPPPSTSSSSPGYVNGRPRSSGGGGGMVVLSRPRSSSGATAHKPAPRLAVPPPVNLPSLRKEHARLDPALSKPSSGHGGSGLGIGNSSSMSWTKPTLPMQDFSDKNGGLKIQSAVEQRSFSSRSQPHGLTEKTVILRGEDFPSLMATSTYVSEQKQRQVNEKSNGLVEKSELSSVVDTNPMLRSSPPTKKIVQGNDGGSSRVLGSLEQSRQGGGKFPGPLPLVRLKHTSDWDDDERDRNRVDHYEGRVFLDSEAHSSLSRDSGRGDSYGKEFMVFRKEDRNFSSWRAHDAPNREILSSRALHVVKDHFGPKNSVLSKGTGKESNHDRLSYGGKKEVSSGMCNGNAGITEGSNDRVEVSNNWQKGKPNTNSKGIIPLRIKGISTNDHLQNFTKEKLMSNAGRYYAEDASWNGKITFSSDAMLDFKANGLRKKKEAVKRTDIFDPARESFEAELERVQWIQEQERQRVMEEQARVAEVARREVEERERIAREEEERRQLLEQVAREAAWRAEQEKLEATRRAEELRIAREEEKKKTLMEEERRKEAARQKLLELEARIASRQSEANVNDRMNERIFSRNSDVEHLTNSSSFDSSSVNRLSDSGFRSQTSSVENHSFVQLGKKENNWNKTSNSIVKFQDQDSDYLTSRKDVFCSSRSFHGKQFQGIHGPKPVTPSFKRGMPGDQSQYGHSWDINRDCDQFNGRSNINAMISGWDLVHFDGSKLDSYTERPFQNGEVDDLASFSRVRRTIRQPHVPPPPSVSSSILKNPCGDASVGPNSSLSVHGDVEINQTGREEESDVQIVYGCSYHQRIIEPGVEPRMMEESTCSLLQTEENISPRYDSQSSLSISNPPSSPTQLSHDEFDDCGGSPPATAYAEEENLTFSEGKSMIPELNAVKINAGIIPFSHCVDEDWAIVDNEKMQEEEDHDEAFDSNQEDNEVHESDAWELQMKNKLEDLNVVVEKLMEIGHAAHGIENHVQLRTSDHYRFNKDSEYHEKTSTNAGHVSDSTSEHTFPVNSAGSLQPGETIPDEILNALSETVEEAAKEQEALIFSLVTTADHPTDGVRTSKNSGQNPIAAVSRLPLPSTSSLCSISASVPTSSGQNDKPAKLQFGLFSSPPLIPSPFPTIQIGSIQTPLFINAQTDSYTPPHPSHPPQPPLLQFGQIAYSPAASQSVLPMTAQTLSCTHHSPLDLHLVNGNTGSSSKNQMSRDFTTTKGLDKGHPSSSADIHSACILGITNPSQSNLAFSDEKKDLHNLISYSGNPDAILNKNFRFIGYSKRNRGRPHVGSFSSARKSLAGLKAPGTISDIRGNRLTYNVRNAGSASSFTRTETSYVNSNRPQRRIQRHIQGTEYRVKESGARQMQCAESFSHSSNSGKPNSGNNLVLLGNMGKKGGVNKSAKLMNEEAAHSGSQVVGTDGNTGRDNRKETLHTSMPASRKFHSGEGNLNNNEHLGDDIDAPLLSGIVRVYNQPGIEASSDGDGFVEVRSKRKISNERRGQREREINPKHKATKRVPHRHRATLSNNGTAYKSDMATTLTGGAAAKTFHSESAIAHRRPPSDMEATKLTTPRMKCQTITAIGSPDVNSADYDSKLNSLMSSRAGSDLAIANDEVNAESSLYFGKNIAYDKVSVPLGTWGTIHLNLQSATSTPSQLDEASKPVQCNPVGATKVPSDDKKLETTSITKEDPSFSSLNLPKFPFDGEKIQFGAVVPPPLLPPSSQAAASSGIWSPGSLILNSSIIHSLPVNNHGERNYFDKEKYHCESCTGLDDTEAEAEAAASAVAVAVITNDEMTAASIGTSSISGIGTKRLSCTGVTSCTDTTCQSASEVIVSLPSDLSVNTPLSLWPPLPTIRSSHPMLSDIVGPQPSHFPFFDSNPMLGGPILAFRPQEESTGAWSQCHSGVEPSFYGSPTGVSAPFMGSPTGVSGVHGRAPMVFYNHFAPIGQFGQVGLGYMGGAYLPTGKPPDWKHISDGAATANTSQADSSNINVVYGQQNAAHLPTSIQHFSTGSGVMQLTSPFTLFNLRPFQSSTEIPVPAQWPPIPHSHSPNSIRLSASAPPEQLQISPPSDLPYSAVNFPDELGLTESSSSNPVNAQTIQSSRNHSTNINCDSNGMMADKVRASSSSSSSSSSSPLQKMMSSGSQHGRRSTFHGEYGSNKSNRNIGSSKMKQIYVAKSVLNSPGGASG